MLSVQFMKILLSKAANEIGVLDGVFVLEDRGVLDEIQKWLSWQNEVF